MNKWSFDITRQSDWDVWSWVCILASLVLVSYAVFGQLWRTARGWLSLALIGTGVGGTLAVLTLPPLRKPGVGMVWTFVLLAILSTTFYLNLLGRLGVRRTGVLLGLRLLALLALVPMLFEPVWSFVTKPKPEKPVLFVIDTSGSMSFPDIQNGPTRIQSVWQAIQPQLEKLNEHFVPQYFAFDTELRELKKPEDLTRIVADGKATDIVTGVRKAFLHTTRDDAVAVLISDGNDNTSADVIGTLSRMDSRVNTVLVGSDAAESASMPNIAVADVQADDDFAVGHESQITAVIKSTALANRVVAVNLGEVDDKGKPIGQLVLTSQQLILQAVPEGQKVVLTYKPATVGVHRLAVWVEPVAGERSTVDNRQEFQGLAIDPSIKVLYIAGRAGPEYKQLHNLLGHDPNIELATLERVRPSGEQFNAYGTVDRQPVPRHIPSTPDEWKKFDVVVLGDLDSSFLSQPQQAQIEQFVGNGGSLLMLGGENSFGPGGYKGTPIEKALPVFVGDLRSPQEADKFIPRLTLEGASHPAMEGLAPWFGVGEQRSEKVLPPLNGNAVVDREKSGAQVLLVHKERPGPDAKPQIVLAVQLYGKGRSAALTLHSTYQWGMPLYGLGQESPYNRLWGQLVRWLAGADVRNRQKGAGVEGLLNKNLYQLGENVRLRALVRDEHGDATKFAQVTVKLKEANAKEEESFTLNPVPAHDGMYDLILPHPAKGEYTAVLIGAKDGKELGRQSLKLSVIPPADELLKIAANPALMHELAVQTHGSSYDIGRFSELVDEMIRNEPPSTRQRQVSVRMANFFLSVPAIFGDYKDWPAKYDLPLQALIVVPLLAVEWILRRRWQLS
jgi:uncharacterized membrane protein